MEIVLAEGNIEYFVNNRYCLSKTEAMRSLREGEGDVQEHCQRSMRTRSPARARVEETILRHLPRGCESKIKANESGRSCDAVTRAQNSHCTVD